MKKIINIFSQNIIALLLVLGIVFLVNYLSSKFSVRHDFTDDKEYTLTASTIQVLKRLEDRLTIKFYFSKEMPPALLPIQERVIDMVEEFKAHSPKTVITDFVDPSFNEDAEKETLGLGIVPLQFNVIEKDKRETKKIYMGFVLYYQDRREVIPAVAQTDNLEYQMDLALLRMTEKELPRVGVYAGTDQQNYQLISQLVQEIGAVTKITDADLKDIVKKNLKAVVIANPMSLKKEWAIALDQMLQEGTDIIIFAGHFAVDESLQVAPQSTGLDDWLADKGVGISDKLLVDIKNNEQAAFQTGYMQVFIPYPFWVKATKSGLNNQHPITAQLEEVLFPWGNSVTFLPDKENSWKATSLIHSSPYAFLQPDETPTVSPQYTSDMTSLPNMKSEVLSVELNQSKNNQGKIYLTTTPYLVKDNFLQQSQSNVLFLANMIEYATWGDQLIGVRSRGKTARPLQELLATQRAWIKWGVTFFTPALVVVLGVIFLYFLKKKRQVFIREVT